MQENIKFKKKKLPKTICSYPFGKHFFFKYLNDLSEFFSIHLCVKKSIFVLWLIQTSYKNS